MAIPATYDVKLMPTDNSVTTTVDSEGVQTMTTQRKYTLLASAAGEDAMTAEATAQRAGDLPQVNELHPINQFLYVESVSTVRLTPIYFDSTVTYVSPEFDSDGDDPLDLDAVITWGTVQSEGEIDMDWNGDPLINLGTEETITGITRRFSDLELTVEKNIFMFDPLVIKTYEGTVNSDEFLGAPPGVAFISKMEASSAKNGPMPYWKVKANVIFRQAYGDTPVPKTWWYRRRHEGLWELKGSGENKVVARAVDGHKQPVTQPVLLDEEGRRLEEGADVFWQYFQLYDELPFLPLGLLP